MENEKEALKKLAETYIAIKPSDKKRLNTMLDEKIEYWLNEGKLFGGNKISGGHMLVYVLQKYRGKLLVRGFLLGYNFDWRKKNPLKQRVIQECYRAIEGVGKAVSRGMYINSGNWYYYESLSWYEVPEYTLYNEYYYGSDYYDGSWHQCRIDLYDRFATPTYNLEKILELKPELKYSMINLKDNVIIYSSKYTMYPELEFLRKLGLEKYENSKLILKKLQSRDSKHFKKFLIMLAGQEDIVIPPSRVNSAYNYAGLNLERLKEYANVDYIRGRMSFFNQEYGNRNEKPFEPKKDAVEVQRIISKSKADWGYYRDYLYMARAVGHDISDEYWRFPYNLKKLHDRVMEEKKAIDDMKHAELNSKLKEVVKNMTKFNANVDGYDIFIPTEYSQIKEQCDVLYQCLLRCGYDKKVLEQKIILVFIRKEGKPIATAEVFYDKKVGQFYADEHDYDNCHPTKEVKSAFYKWLETFNPRKRNLKKILPMLNNQGGGVLATV